MARKIEVQIVGDASNLSRALNNATGSAGKFGSALGSLAKAGVFAAGAAGLGAMFVTLRAGISEYTQAAKVGAQTNAVIKSTGSIANVTSKDVDRLAESLMRKSGVDDEAIKTGENMLLTFKNIRNEVGAGNNIFDQTTQAVLDMDVAMTHGNSTSESLSKTAIRVGKALNDPVKGMTALAKVGVTFTEGQKKMVAEMVKSGDVMGAQKLILKELTSEFGGSAKALGDTLPGQINKLKESFNNFAGSLIETAIPTVQRFVTWLNTNLIPAEGFTAKLKVVWEGVAQVATELWDQIVLAWNGDQRRMFLWTENRIEVVGTEGFGQKIKDKIRESVAAIDWSDVLLTVGVGIGKGVLRLQQEIWQFLFTAWKAAWSMLLTEGASSAAGLAVQVQRGLGNLRSAITTTVLNAARGAASAIATAAVSAYSAAMQLGRRVVLGVLQGLGNLVSAVAGKMMGVVAAIGGVIGAAFSAAAGIGKAIVSGVLSGIGGIAEAVGSKIASGVRAGIDWAARNVGSTAQEYADAKLGKPMGQGVIDGWIKSTATLPEKMSATLKAAIEKARATIEAARDRLGSAFDVVSARILRAFDAINAATLTPSEKILREVADRRELEDAITAQTNAQIALNEAIASGDAAAIAAAQRAKTRADEDVTLIQTRKDAAAERIQLDSQNEEKRLALERRLVILEKHFTKEGASVKKAMAGIAAIMKSFDIDFATAGQLVGEAFVQGLVAAIKATGTAAAGVDKSVPGASGYRPPATLPVSGPAPIVVNINAPIGSERDMEDMVVAALSNVRNRGGLAPI